MMIPNYIRHVFWSPENNAWIATITELPELETAGDTPEAAIAALGMELETLAAEYADEGWTLPQQNTVPAGLPGWSYLVLIVALIGLIWLAMRFMPAGW